MPKMPTPKVLYILWGEIITSNIFLLNLQVLKILHLSLEKPILKKNLKNH